jgi:dynein heavy chain, axonemal
MFLLGCCRERLRQFPSLVNCCTIDWYTPWPADALSAVATKFLAPVAASTVPSSSPAADSNTCPSAGDPEATIGDIAAAEKMTKLLARACQSIHAAASDLSTRFRREAGRITYVTPTSYLELLTMFSTLLVKRKAAVAKQQKRYSVCPPLVCKSTCFRMLLQDPAEQASHHLETSISLQP